MYFKECPICCKEFRVYTSQKRTYCSIDCMKEGYKTQLRGENNPNYKHGPKACKDCGKNISRNAKEVCRRCMGKRKEGDKNPFYGKSHSEESRNKISETNTGHKYWLGKKHSEESKKKSSVQKKQQWHDYSDEMRAKLLEALKRGCESQLALKKTKPELAVKQILDSNSIENEYNKYVYDKFFVDFFIPGKNAVIEVFGDYWHGNPELFPTPSQKQTRQMGKDRSRIAYLEKCGHSVLVVWEKDIKADLQAVEKRVLEFLGKNNGNGS